MMNDDGMKTSTDKTNNQKSKLKLIYQNYSKQNLEICQKFE